jgi:hypothetical protein
VKNNDKKVFAYNSTYSKAGVSFSVDSFVVVERSVGRIKIYGEKYAHSQSA